MGLLSDRDDIQESRVRIPDTTSTENTVSQYDRLSAFLNSAAEVTYSDTELDPFSVYMKNLNSEDKSHDSVSGFLDSMGYEVSSQFRRGEISGDEAASVADQISQDMRDPELGHKLGAEIIAPANPESLMSDLRINKLLKESLDSKGTGETVWEYAKSILIPGRDIALDYEMFGALGFGGSQENFVNNFHSLDDAGQQEALGAVLRKMGTVDGYWLEKIAFLQDLTSTSSALENQALRQAFMMMDVAGAIGEIGVAAKLMSRSNNISNSLKKAGNPNMAGQTNAAALQNPQAATNLGVDRDMAFLDTLNTNRVLDTVNSAASQTLQATGRMYDPSTVTKFRDAVKDELQSVNLLKPETFSPEEITNQVDKFVKEQVRALNAGTKAKTVTPPNYDVVDFKDGEIIIKIDYGSGEQQQKVKATGNAWGQLEQLAESDHTFQGGAKSPKFYLRRKDGKTTINRMVEDAGIIETTRPVLQDIFGDAYAAAVDHAGAFWNKNKVARALKAQDDEKALNQDRMFTPDELEQQFNMSKKQIDSYYMVNSLLDTAGDIESYMRWRKADLAGVKEVDLSAGSKVFGRRYSSKNSKFEQALAEHQLSGVDRAYDPASNKIVKIKDKKLKANNQELVVLDTPESVSGIGKVQVIVVPKKSIKDVRLESMSLHRVGGYIPRIREDAKYFVKEDYKDNINGKEVIKTRTYAGASTRQEAEKLRESRQADIDSGAVTDVVSLKKIAYDREGISPSSDSTGGSGQGLFTGHRATHDIEWGGTAGERMEPLRAIAKNLQHVSTMYPSNEWKVAMVERFKNTVRASNTPQKNDPELGLHTPIDQGTPEGRQLEAVRKYISGVTGIPDEETLSWEGLTRTFSERLDSYKNGAGRRVRRLNTKDPIGGLKYLAFQSLLGWFNPAQLFVQATNLASAVSLHPWLTARHMNKMLGLRAIMDAKDDGLVASAAKKLTLNPDELIDIKRQFKRAGLDQIQTNADMDSAIMGFGTTMRAFRKASNTGLIFYRNGELAARTVSYVVARQKYLRENKIKSWKQLSDQDHRRIKETFDNLSLNLGRENKARFQRGLLSIPTQFWHVQTKFVEQFFGKKFTATEKIRLALGQAALFGAAGIPFGKRLAEDFGNYFREDAPISEDFVRQGMMSWIASDLELAGRGGIPNQLTEQVWSIFQDTNDPMWEKMMGASGILFTRGSYAANLTSSWLFDQSPVEETEFWEVVRGWAGIVSTVNNAEQAFWMNKLNKFINKRSGQIQFDSPTNREIFGKAIGFQTTREVRIWEMQDDVKKFDEYKKRQVDRFFQHIYSKGLDVTTIDFSEKFSSEIKVFVEMFSGGDPWMRQELAKSIWKKLSDGKDKETEQMKATLRKEMSTEFMSYYNINYAQEEIGSR